MRWVRRGLGVGATFFFGGGGRVDVSNWSKMLFLGPFYLQILINFHGFYVQKTIHYIENKNGL